MKHAQPQSVPLETPAPHMAAHKIRAYRARHGLSQRALAHDLGVSAPAVVYWERGARHASHSLQAALHSRGICDPNDWHLPAPPPSRTPANI